MRPFRYESRVATVIRRRLNDTSLWLRLTFTSRVATDGQDLFLKLGSQCDQSIDPPSEPLPWSVALNPTQKRAV